MHKGLDMDSIEATVGAAVGLQQANAMAEAQNSLVRKVLDNQADLITSLVDSAIPQLSSYGMVGTQLHVTA
ncbi:hypothetical protein CEY05_14470 [Achromobacter sp. HZ34]|nr:hypothetical protein CEY05_14470 [Achromobacter sp. HZ34]